MWICVGYMHIEGAGSKLTISARPVSALGHWTISPALKPRALGGVCVCVCVSGTDYLLILAQIIFEPHRKSP